MLAPAARDIVPFVDLLQERRDILGSVLKVAVHGDDHVALRFVKTRRKSRRLAKIAAQPDHFQVLVGFHKIRQQLEAAVGRGVVHEKNLIRPFEFFEHRRQAIVER
jgi:hypothetical protein